MQAGRDLREASFSGSAVGVGFLVDEGGFGNGGSGGSVFLEFFGSGPIDQRGRKFFPFFALSTVVADAVAFDLILGDGLIGAVFEDKAAGEFLGGGVRGEGESEGRQEGGDYGAAGSDSRSHRIVNYHPFDYLVPGDGSRLWPGMLPMIQPISRGLSSDRGRGVE